MHFELIVQPPSESDPEGYSVLACGRETGNYTNITKFVDCKNCLKRMSNVEKSKSEW